MEFNFGVILSEMTNGEAFHISDNGRILSTTRNHGGARPKKNGTIAILSKYLDTPTINLRTPTIGLHMAPVT